VVFPQYCTAKLISGYDPLDPRIAHVVVLNWNNDMLRLKVHFLKSASDLPQTSQALDEYVLAVGYQQGELVVVGRSDDGKLEIERLDELTSNHADKILGNIEPSHLEHALVAAARFNFRLYHPNTGHLRPVDVIVDMRRLKKLNDPQDLFSTTKLNGVTRPLVYVPDPDRKNLFEHTRETEVVPMKGELYGLTLKNNSPFDLFPYVFYFDPYDYTIQVKGRLFMII
jgi:hypothetical protein